MRRSEVAAISAEAKFRHGTRPVAGKDLHDARHRVGTIERALRASLKFDAIRLRERNASEIERAARFVHRYTVNENFVVARISATYEQRPQPATLARHIDHRSG